MKTLNQTIRIVLADDHTLVRAGLRALLETMPHIEVVGEAGDGREVVELAGALSPDIVLMDVTMPNLNGLEATDRIVKQHPETRVVVLSVHQDEEYVWRALRAGASGYVLKNDATAELHNAIECVLEGKLYISDQIAARFKQLPDALEERTSPLDQLTGRQREVLQLIAEGKNTKEIADILKVSPKTIEYHRIKIMEALRVYDIPGLVRFAMRTGLVAHES
jgi:DNA-binding NarL/FixJ family response regulator